MLDMRNNLSRNSDIEKWRFLCSAELEQIEIETKSGQLGHALEVLEARE